MKKISYAAAVLFFTFFVFTKLAFALSLTGSTSFSGTATVALPITDVQISGDGAATTPVKLFVSNGSLAMSTTTGLTFTGPNTGSVLYFSGTVAHINTALATLTYTRTSAGSDTLEISLVNPDEVFFGDNGHVYKFISGEITWEDALLDAATQTAYGATGYLATITSQSENEFISARIVADGWIGASDVGMEGDWKWVTGPETGMSFWLTDGESGGTVNGQYANWNGGEPNDSGGDEDCAQYYSGSSMWNDLPCSGSTLSGYMAEFGDSGNIPTVVARNVDITTEAFPVISSTTPADNATNIVPSANLSIIFNKTIQVGTGNIVIKKTSDNTTVQTIDVTSGQVAGSGTNTITINPTADLSYNTSYYIQIDGTAFRDSSNNNFAGIANTTSWNFTTQTAYTLAYTAGANGTIAGTASQIVVAGGNGTAVTAVPDTGYTFISWSDASTANPRTDTNISANRSVTAIFADVTAPSISAIVTTPRRYDATISWNTDEVASSLVAYGTSPEYGTTTAEADTSPRVSSHSVTLTGLLCNTTYYANPKSNDSWTNQGFGSGISFTTLSCPSSGGGGGVVTPRAIQQTTKDTVTKLDFIINTGEKKIQSNTLTIHLNADPTKVSSYAISLSPTFNDTGIRALPTNNIDTFVLPNTYGTYTIYMQYYSTSGHTSPLISRTVTYMPGVGAVAHAGSVIPNFKKTLRYGDKGTDVRTLQQFLNTHGAPVALSGPGSLCKESNIFSKKVIAAVKAYQKQKGIKPANGVVGPKTKAIMMADTK